MAFFDFPHSRSTYCVPQHLVNGRFNLACGDPTESITRLLSFSILPAVLGQTHATVNSYSHVRNPCSLFTGVIKSGQSGVSTLFGTSSDIL